MKADLAREVEHRFVCVIVGHKDQEDLSAIVVVSSGAIKLTESLALHLDVAMEDMVSGALGRDGLLGPEGVIQEALVANEEVGVTE